jgi:hypothetical protein
MKLSKFVVTVALLLSFAAFPTFAKNETVERAHRTTHVIRMTDALDISPTKCSATAIGPHALLTASHCEVSSDEILVDNKNANVAGILRDGADHSIVYVDITFPQWAVISEELPCVADHVFIFGNPGDVQDVYREGYVASIKSGEVVPFGKLEMVVYFDLNGFRGDSGAAVFDKKGEIVGVVSTLVVQFQPYEKENVQMKLMGGLIFQFTPEQLLATASWKNGDAVPKKDIDTARRVVRKVLPTATQK